MKLELLTCEMLTWNKEKLQLIVHLCKLGSDFPIEIWQFMHEFIFIWNHSEGIEPLFAHGISLKKELRPCLHAQDYYNMKLDLVIFYQCQTHNVGVLLLQILK